MNAYDKGYLAGKADARMGRRLDYVWFTSPNDPNDYARQYASGYRRAFQLNGR